MTDMPVDLVYDWVRDISGSNPEDMIRLAQAIPEMYFTGNINLAVLDARRNARPGLVPLSSEPLITLAIGMRDSIPLGTLAYFLTAWLDEDPNSLNGILASGRRMEPVLHTAVRSGHVELVRLLLDRFPSVDLGVVYDQDASPSRCQLAHAPPCPPANAASRCVTAVDAAVEFATQELDPSWRADIERAAVLLAEVGPFPSPADDAGSATELIVGALRMEMYDYVQTIVRRTFELAQTDQRFLNLAWRGGIITVTREALVRSNSTNLIRSIIEEANSRQLTLCSTTCRLSNALFPQGLSGERAVAHLPNAILIMKQYIHEARSNDRVLKELTLQLIESRNVKKIAARDELQEYFLLELEATELVVRNLGRVPGYLRPAMRIAMDEIGKIAFWSGRSGAANTRHLICDRGFNSVYWLGMCIRYKNIEALREVLNICTARGDNLRAFVEFSDGDVATPLVKCFTRNFLSGILEFLRRGIPASDVYSHIWWRLREQLKEDFSWVVSNNVTERRDGYNLVLYLYYGADYLDPFTGAAYDDGTIGNRQAQERIISEANYLYAAADDYVQEVYGIRGSRRRV
ncbi:hypothetical protein GGR52DRAFT_589891 [Hypoxylon sp. FL1284]|nr:hypothetical protein GGR52DRAFT_589891 [Hypoxylon sp. FL1284]